MFISCVCLCCLEKVKQRTAKEQLLDEQALSGVNAQDSKLFTPPHCRIGQNLVFQCFLDKYLT